MQLKKTLQTSDKTSRTLEIVQWSRRNKQLKSTNENENMHAIFTMSTSKMCRTFKNEATCMGETDPWAADAAAFTKLNAHVLSAKPNCQKLATR